MANLEGGGKLKQAVVITAITLAAAAIGTKAKKSAEHSGPDEKSGRESKQPAEKSADDQQLAVDGQAVNLSNSNLPKRRGWQSTIDGSRGTPYVVQGGDNLYKIAGTHLGDGNRWKEIQDLNKLPNPDDIEPGQIILIPASTSRSAGTKLKTDQSYIVPAGYNLERIAKEELGDKNRWREIATLNDISDPTKLQAGQGIELPSLQPKPKTFLGKVKRIFQSEQPNVHSKILADKKTFSSGLKHVLLCEGGVNSDPKDRGNEGGNVTYKGVTQTSYNEYCSKWKLRSQKVNSLSDKQIANYYYRHYWTPAHCEEMPKKLAVIHLDTAVNMGVRGAACLLQEALGVEVSGGIGPITLNAIRQADQKALLHKYLDVRLKRYRQLKQFGRYGNGWENRVKYYRDSIVEKPIGTLALARTIPAKVVGSSETRNAVSALQQKAGLKVTGELNPETLLIVDQLANK